MSERFLIRGASVEGGAIRDIRDDADDIGFGINDTAQGAVILPHSQN